ALAEAGHVSDAKWILEKIIKHAEQLSGWQRLDGLRAVRALQKTIDDKEGMARTDKLIQVEITKFAASSRHRPTVKATRPRKPSWPKPCCSTGSTRPQRTKQSRT